MLDSTDAELLLSELQRRVANEVAASIAAMQLVKSSRPRRGRHALLDHALERMEGFGLVNSVLSLRQARPIDVSDQLHKLCRGLVAGRMGLDRAKVQLLLPRTVIDGHVAHRLLLIASELIFNAIRHALVDRPGSVVVSINTDCNLLRLVVTDNGPGIRAEAASRGTGRGSDIVARLVRRSGGRLECQTDQTGTTFRVFLPLREEQDDHVPF